MMLYDAIYYIYSHIPSRRTARRADRGRKELRASLAWTGDSGGQSLQVALSCYYFGYVFGCVYG